MSGRFRMIVVGAALTLIISHGDLAAQSGPPLRIGHYSTGSGLIGFVIDRMGTPIKLRFDGSDESGYGTAGCVEIFGHREFIRFGEVLMQYTGSTSRYQVPRSAPVWIHVKHAGRPPIVPVIEESLL